MNRPITDEPFDLERALRSAADAVQPTTDDAVAGQRLHSAVRRVRRRRAGLVGTAAALVLVLGGVGVTAAWDRSPEPLMPAPAPSPDPTGTPTPTDPAPTPSIELPAPVTTEQLRCGNPAPAATGPDLLATVSVETSRPTVRSTMLVDVAATLRVTDGADVTVLDPPARAGYVLVQDGIVVSSTSALPRVPDDRVPTSLTSGSEVPLTIAVDSLAACPPLGTVESPSLLPGEYELAVIVPWTVSSATTEPGAETPGAAGVDPLFDGWLVSATVPFVVEPAGEEETEPEGPDGLEHAADGPTRAFPAGPTSADLECGMPAPAPSTSLLAYLALPGNIEVGTTSPRSTGSMLYGDSLARAEATFPAAANAYVVLRDGTIVSSTRSSSRMAADLRTMVDGTETPVPFEYSAEIHCGDGAATGQMLTPGTYTYQGLLPWTITSYSLLQKDGSWGATQTAGGAPLFQGWLVSEQATFVVR
ncbi:hypothetical protein AB0O99_14330 [Cellulosimicrobium funkei]|uniref:hypothetical protein n=1 Tax=Cellulosimicrobium funkei TaxID=264251 RepID=UPI0034130C49